MNLRKVAGLAASMLFVWAGASIGTRAFANEPSLTPARACSSLLHLRIPGSDMVITHVDTVPTAPAGTVRSGPGPQTIPVALPAYCRVKGIIDSHRGPDGKSYGLTFALALPQAWNGRFLFQGGGGLNGVLRPPLGIGATGDRPALARGFAVVSTDGGHRGAVFDSSFLVDQQASLDFAFNAVPTVTAVAKRLVAIYYGRPAARSYF
ncbi:MAG: tannase/feruloyl esterase family alpha/beta hydrolase, partial [Steroidobacteraceae bacterium]